MPAFAREFGARSLVGSLALRAVADFDGTTRLVEIERRPPMQVLRPLYVDASRPGFATVQVINSTAGLFAGDGLSSRIEVSSGARFAVSTPAMTRVHAMPDGGAATSLVDLRVRAGRYLDYLPAPTVLCEDAALFEQMRIDVDIDAHAAIGEVWAFGRVAHGELHAYRELNVRTELRRDGSLVLADALALEPSAESPEPSVGGYAAYGTLTLSGPRVDAALLTRVRCFLDHRGEQTLAGASTLSRGGGVAVRVLGPSANSVHTTLGGLITEFRRCVLAVERPRCSTSARSPVVGGVR